MSVSNTAIQSRDYSSPGEEDALKRLLVAQQAGATAATQDMDNKAKLAQLLSGQNNEAKLKQQAEEQDLARAQKAYDDSSGNASVKTGSASLGADQSYKTAQMQQAQANKDLQNSMKAYGSATSTYNKGVPKLQAQAQALGELHDVLENPNQMSQGLARTLLLKSMGMTRYNGDEAKNILPGSLYGSINGLFNKGGADESTLNDNQVQAIAQFAGHAAQNLQQKHETLKQTALDQYSQNPGSKPEMVDKLKTSLGGPLDQQIGHLSQATASLQAKRTPQAQAQPGVLDAVRGGISNAGSALANLFNPSPKAPPQAQPMQPQQAPMAPSKAPAGPFNPDDYLKGQ